jgi:dihydroneopterin aldolase
LDGGVSDPDQILVSNLQVSCLIGVPEEERAVPQRLLVSLRVYPHRNFTGLEDEIGNTVDYYVLTRRIQGLAGERPRKLIETLAEEIATTVLREFAVQRVEVELRKFILPDADFVAVCIMREV